MKRTDFDDENAFDRDYSDENLDAAIGTKSGAISAAIGVVLLVVAVFTVIALTKENDPVINNPGNSITDRINDGSMNDMLDRFNRGNDYVEPTNPSSDPMIPDDTPPYVYNPADPLYPLSEGEDTPNIQTSAESASELVLSLPLKRLEVSLAYSYKSSVVYSPTLESYRSDHTGVDLKAEIGEDVRAAANGKVSMIYDDERYGKTVIIDSGEKVTTIYANLDENIKVTLNQTVKSGDVIGYVGNTAAYELADKAHLHFGLTVNDEFVDPTPYLKNK